VWRGSGSPNISVSAPFVWRCLTGSDLAPFPHTGWAEAVACLGGERQQKARAEKVLPSIEFKRGVCVVNPAVVDGSQCMKGPELAPRGLRSQPAEGLLTEAVLKHARVVPASSPTALASVSVCTALPNGASGRLAARRGKIGQSVKCGMGHGKNTLMGWLRVVTGPSRRVCETRLARNGKSPAPPTHIRWHPIRSDRGSYRQRSRPPSAPCLSWCRGGVLHL
jgi:hypothetical protein